LWVLGNEESTRWKAWEPTWNATLNDQERRFLKFTNKLRVDEVHHTGVETLVVWEEVALHELLSANFDRDRRNPAYAVQLFNQSAMPLPSPKTTRRAHYFEHEDGTEEVTALCDRYLKFLEKVLSDFEQAHQS